MENKVTFDLDNTGNGFDNKAEENSHSATSLGRAIEERDKALEERDKVIAEVSTHT
jgi:hypothetical protein